MGKPFTATFALLSSGPVAAASIGQVYKATLLATNTTVAIKIQRPGVAPQIALDLYILRWWSKLWSRAAQLAGKDIDVEGIIDDFGELIYAEIDYRAEGRNAVAFGEEYKDLGDVVTVPGIYEELTTSKVLVMDWIDGVRLTDTAQITKLGLSRRKLVDSMVQCSLRQILDNGFYLADPHGSNLLAMPDGKLAYLDFGMMGYCTQKQRSGFLLAVVLMVDRD